MPWLLLTDQPLAAVSLQAYGLRVWIEHGLRIRKRAGWHWHRTRRPDPDRVARPWLVMAAATLLALAHGTRVEAAADVGHHPWHLTQTPARTVRRRVSVFRLTPLRCRIWQGLWLRPKSTCERCLLRTDQARRPPPPRSCLCPQWRHSGSPSTDVHSPTTAAGRGCPWLEPPAMDRADFSRLAWRTPCTGLGFCRWCIRKGAPSVGCRRPFFLNHHLPGPGDRPVLHSTPSGPTHGQICSCSMHREQTYTQNSSSGKPSFARSLFSSF